MDFCPERIGLSFYIQIGSATSDFTLAGAQQGAYAKSHQYAVHHRDNDQDAQKAASGLPAFQTEPSSIYGL